MKWVLKRFLKWLLKGLLKLSLKAGERSERVWAAGWEEAWSSARRDGLTRRAWAHCVWGERESRQVGRLEAV